MWLMDRSGRPVTGPSWTQLSQLSHSRAPSAPNKTNKDLNDQIPPLNPLLSLISPLHVSHPRHTLFQIPAVTLWSVSALKLSRSPKLDVFVCCNMQITHTSRYTTCWRKRSHLSEAADGVAV